MSNKIRFDIKKIPLKFVVYAAIAILTIVLFSILLAWSAEKKVLTVVDCGVVVAEGTRTEYLIGENVSGEGISLDIGSGALDGCTVSVDTASAGIKRATVTKVEGDKMYRGYYDVRVFAVRHFDMKNMRFDTDAEGGPVCSFELKADLDSHPSELFVEDPEMPNVITITPDMYTVSLLRDGDSEDRYKLSIDIGGTNFSYTCIDVGGRFVQVNSDNNILELKNRQAGGLEKLTLYVTKITTLGGDGSDKAEGVYLYVDAKGKKHVYNFRYYAIGYTSYFDSAAVNPDDNVSDRYLGDDGEFPAGMEVNINGLRFAAQASPWHRAVFGRDV